MSLALTQAAESHLPEVVHWLVVANDGKGYVRDRRDEFSALNRAMESLGRSKKGDLKQTVDLWMDSLSKEISQTELQHPSENI